ncbi:hypothetical protein L1280_001330 [Deinococcus sp. HSC-46F16]|uniref:hypothetical protein n=1 Tax=Deinococcus sp. HSC-46F16 TaxID=2910968 RepID=UPI00209C74A9|nr:hypothetical protein [Deinococcus sp. HSC-46F16]MCP2014193.1 hypothetical protein [Deinococcus sp. HSC-46F16]
MRAFRLPLMLLVLGSVALAPVGVHAAPAGTPLPSGWLTRLVGLLPQPGQSAQLMDWQPSRLIVTLTARVAETGGDREALRTIMSKFQRGEKLAYDPRLGISRAEFDSYVLFEPSLVPSNKRVKLPVTREGNRLRFGDVAGLAGVLRGLEIDLLTGELRAPEGFSGKPQAFVADNGQERALDVQSGFEWNLRGNNPYTQNGINLIVQLVALKGGQIVLSVSRFSMMNGRTSDGRVIVQYVR